MSNEVQPGTKIHWLKSGIIYGTAVGTRVSSEISRRGAELVITADMIEGTKDRNGDSWLSLIYDEDAQIARWSEVVIGLGNAPTHLSPWAAGWRPESLAEADEERVKARAHAETLALDDRADAIAKINKTVGRESTSRTVQTYTQGDAR